MSDQLTAPTDPVEQPRRGPALVQFALAVVLLAVVGAIGGVVWDWVWTPAVGVVVDHKWIAEDEAGLRGQFSSTGWFVVVATVAGLVGGALVALLFDRVPLLTLLAVVVGSVVGTWLMIQVGAAVGPDDPRHLALAAKDGTHLPARLEVARAASGDLPDQLGFARRSPLIALPGGALVGFTLVFFGLSARARVRD